MTLALGNYVIVHTLAYEAFHTLHYADYLNFAQARLEPPRAAAAVTAAFATPSSPPGQQSSAPPTRPHEPGASSPNGSAASPHSRASATRALCSRTSEPWNCWGTQRRTPLHSPACTWDRCATCSAAGRQDNRRRHCPPRPPCRAARSRLRAGCRPWTRPARHSATCPRSEGACQPDVGPHHLSSSSSASPMAGGAARVGADRHRRGRGTNVVASPLLKDASDRVAPTCADAGSSAQ